MITKMRVWLHDEFKDADADEREDRAWVSPSDHLKDAVKLFAEYQHNSRDGWEWTWPIKVVVHDGEHYWIVVVHREYAPEFWPDKPKPFTMAGDQPQGACT